MTASASEAENTAIDKRSDVDNKDQSKDGARSSKFWLAYALAPRDACPLHWEFVPVLTAKRVREVLDYDPETGVFRWKESRGRVAAGSVAGCSLGTKWGAWVVRIDSVLHYAHRLAWLYVHGEWPPAQIDHRDGNPLNNCISNLRLATPSQNNQNKRVMNATGFKGVSFARKSGKWMARIKLGGKTKYIGVYASKDEAGAAYEAAARHHFGEFART